MTDAQKTKARLIEECTALRQRVEELEGHVADRKQGEYAFQHNQELYRALAEKTYDIVAEFDTAGRFIYLSPNTETTLGFAPEELVGQHYSEILPPEGMVRVNEGFGRAVEEGATAHRLTQVRHRGGSWRWIEGTAFRFETPAGEMRLVGIGRDVTERKQMEEQLVRSERLASIGTLAAGLAHEINNPLGGALLAAQFALEFKDDSAAVANALQAIVRQTKRCAEVVSGVLKFAQEGSSDQRLTDLNSVTRHSKDVIHRYAEKRGATIEFVPAGGLPEVRINETEMGLAIVNLIRNAVQAGANHIHLRTQHTQDCVDLIIQDNGSGIPEDQKRRIFEPFYTTRNKQGGMGLGLSIAHGIVTGYKGTIDVESEQGKGTALTICLPFAQDEDGQGSDR